MLNSLRLCISFFTCLSLANNLKPNSWAASLRYITIPGLLFGLLNLGILSCGLNYFKLQTPVIAFLLILGNLILSGALHLDGLMDSFDGIASNRKTREEILLVLKDSRVGAFGALAGMLAILGKFAALVSIDFALTNPWTALIMIPVISRFLMLLVIHFEVDANISNSSLALFKQDSSSRIWGDILFSCLFITGLIVILQISSWQFLIYYIPCSALTWMIYKWLKLRLKGHNGDSLGAGLEISETLFYLLLSFSC